MRLYETIENGSQSTLDPYNSVPIRPESELETLLHANPMLIADELLVIIGRQVRLNSGVADLLACDEFGNVVVIEVKIGQSGTGSASEETILSQPQTYASDLSSYDYAALNELYQNYRSRLAENEWGQIIEQSSITDLDVVIEETFGKPIDRHEFNIEQRLVVVAEEITRCTAASVRYLLEQGLHFQCTEVCRFVHDANPGEDNVIIASTPVVMYDNDRVRPPGRPSPTYSDLIRELVTPVFPDIREQVHADNLHDAFPGGFDTRGASLESRHSDHPEGVVYYVSPEPDAERVTIGVHNMNEDPEIVERLQENRERFERAGLTVKNNPRYNLVWKRWSVETVEDVRDIQIEVSEHYKRMVSLGHDVLTEEDSLV